MRGYRPIYNSSIAVELGYVSIEDAAGSGAPEPFNVAPNAASIVTKGGQPALVLGAIAVTATKATVATKVNSPTLTLGAITVTPAKGTLTTKSGSPAFTLTLLPAKGTIVVKGGVPALGGVAANLAPDNGEVATKGSQPTLVLGSIAVTADKGEIVVAVGSPALTLGDITLTPDKATIVTKSGVAVLSGIPIDIYPDLASIVVTATEPTILYFPTEVRGGHGEKPTFRFERPKPPTQLEKEIKAMVDVYRTEAAIQAREQASERQKMQNLEMGRRQADINRQLNRRPKERPDVPQKPLIDGVKLQKMIERAQKQTQSEIDLANKVRMAKVRAAKRKTKVKR